MLRRSIFFTKLVTSWAQRRKQIRRIRSHPRPRTRCVPACRRLRKTNLLLRNNFSVRISFLLRHRGVQAKGVVLGDCSPAAPVTQSPARARDVFSTGKIE